LTDSFVIEVADRQTALKVDRRQIVRAVRMILRDAAVGEAEISVAIVDDPTIHGLNRQYLGHDCATDVLSFALEREEDLLEGEVIVSAETAQSQAPGFGWAASQELLLYVIHGALHLVGYDDGSPEERVEMRARERDCLMRLGIEPPGEEPRPAELATRRRKLVADGERGKGAT
jgi:probable rRNA maturation factor